MEDPLPEALCPCEHDAARSMTVSCPFALVFFSSEGITVQYCLRVRRGEQQWLVAKRFRDILTFCERSRDILGDGTLSLLFPSRRTVPRLTRSTMGRTNDSLTAIARRRDEVDQYFRALSGQLRQKGCDALGAHVAEFCPHDCCPPMGLLPKDHRAPPRDDLVQAVFRVPRDTAAGAVVPRVLVSLPRVVMFLNHRDQLNVALRSDKAQRSRDVIFRFNEAAAFFSRVVCSGADRLPTTTEARAFFNDYRASHKAPLPPPSPEGPSLPVGRQTARPEEPCRNTSHSADDGSEAGTLRPLSSCRCSNASFCLASWPAATEFRTVSRHTLRITPCDDAPGGPGGGAQGRTDDDEVEPQGDLELDEARGDSPTCAEVQGHSWHHDPVPQDTDDDVPPRGDACR